MSDPTPRRFHGAIIYLGILLILQGAGKLWNVADYAWALGEFHVFPLWTLLPIGVLWMMAEVVCGGLLVYAGASRTPARALALLGGLGAMAITLGYALLTSAAWLRGLDVPNCTCFGVLLPQALSPVVLAQDAAMIAWNTYVLLVLVRLPGQ